MILYGKKGVQRSPPFQQTKHFCKKRYKIMIKIKILTIHLGWLVLEFLILGIRFQLHPHHLSNVLICEKMDKTICITFVITNNT